MQAQSPSGDHPTTCLWVVLTSSRAVAYTLWSPAPAFLAPPRLLSPRFWGSRSLSRRFGLALTQGYPTLLLSPELIPPKKPQSAKICKMMSFSSVHMSSHHWPIGRPLQQMGPNFRLLNSLFSPFQSFNK